MPRPTSLWYQIFEASKSAETAKSTQIHFYDNQQTIIPVIFGEIHPEPIKTEYSWWIDIKSLDAKWESENTFLFGDQLIEINENTGGGSLALLAF